MTEQEYVDKLNFEKEKLKELRKNNKLYSMNINP